MKYIIILLLIISSAVAQTCSPEDGCFLECPGGDSDCSCESQKGIICSKDEFCPSDTIKNWDNSVCCTEECISSEETPENDKSLAVLKTIEKPEQFKPQNIKKEVNYGVLALLLSVIALGFVIKSIVKIRKSYE